MHGSGFEKICGTFVWRLSLCIEAVASSDPASDAISIQWIWFLRLQVEDIGDDPIGRRPS